MHKKISMQFYNLKHTQYILLDRIALYRTSSKRLLIRIFTCPCLLVAVGDGDPSYRTGVTAQEEKRDVACGGHQVDQHGHANSTQSWQVELLHQQAPKEDTQTGTGDGRHTWDKKQEGVKNISRVVLLVLLSLEISTSIIYLSFLLVEVELDNFTNSLSFTIYSVMGRGRLEPIPSVGGKKKASSAVHHCIDLKKNIHAAKRQSFRDI